METERRRMYSDQTYEKFSLCFNEGWVKVSQCSWPCWRHIFLTPNPDISDLLSHVPWIDVITHYHIYHYKSKAMRCQRVGRIKIGFKTSPPPPQKVPGIGYDVATCSKRGKRSQASDTKKCSSEILCCWDQNFPLSRSLPDQHKTLSWAWRDNSRFFSVLGVLFSTLLQVASSAPCRTFLLFWRKVNAVFMYGNEIRYKE